MEMIELFLDSPIELQVLLLSILPAHNIQNNIETISSCYLSNEALKIIIQTANECEFLFAKGSV